MKKETKEPIGLKDLKCPICGNPINWIKPAGFYYGSGVIVLLAECWGGEHNQEEKTHLFLIQLQDLPEIDLTEGGN